MTDCDKFRVVTWNVLGHIHTHWNGAAHLNTKEDSSPVTAHDTQDKPAQALNEIRDESRPRESSPQRRRRHTRLIEALTQLQPDVILLQEVDPHFMPSEEDYHAGTPFPLPGYTPHRSSSVRGEGTAVLLRDACWVVDPITPPVRFPPTVEHGWKTGTVVHARRVGADPNSQPYAFASVHLRHENTAAQNALLESALAAMDPRAIRVLGGDFNLERARIGDVEETFECKGLRRVEVDQGPTTLGGCAGIEPGFRPGDGEERVIDHVWISDELKPSAVRDGEGGEEKAWAVGMLPFLPEHPRGPWGDGPSDGSDHAWIRVDLSCL